MATSETLFFILELLATIQGLVVGAYLIWSTTKGKPTLILALFLILFSLEMCPSILRHMDLWQGSWAQQWLPLRNIWLLSPLFFLYTQKVSIFKKKKKAYWMFLPGILLLLLKPVEGATIDCLGLPSDGFVDDRIFLVGHAYCFFIAFLNIRYINAHSKEVKQVFSSLAMKELQWAKTFVYYGVVLCMASVMVYFLDIGYGWWRLPFVLAQLFTVYWLSFYGTKQLNVARVLENPSEYGLVFGARAAAKKPERKPKAYGQIMVKLQDYFHEKNPYTDPELTIVDVAVALEVHPKKLSKAINGMAGQNFNTFVNGHRVNRAKALLKDPAHRNITIDGVGREVGFQSKSAFYAAFKKMTGRTPLAFQKAKTG